MILYAGAIALTAAVPSLVANPPAVHPLVIGSFFASGILVGFAVVRRFAGQFRATFFQGILSVGLLMWFGFLNPLAFFLIGAHVCFAMLLAFWIDLIYDAHR